MEELKVIKKEDFSREIDAFLQKTNTSIMDAIIHVATSRGLELESISSLLTPDLKKRLKGEAMRLNLVDREESIEFVSNT